jgi:hypothetical protein
MPMHEEKICHGRPAGGYIHRGAAAHAGLIDEEEEEPVHQTVVTAAAGCIVWLAATQ